MSCILCLWLTLALANLTHDVHADPEVRMLTQVSSVPDIPSFPYVIHLVHCQFKSPGDGTANPTLVTSYNCFYFCQATLSAPFLVATGASCVQNTASSFTLESIPSGLSAFDVSAGTSDSDESIRYKITAGGLIYVCHCTGTPCTDTANLMVMGQVFSSTSISVGSKSHYCTTCTAKKPIFTVSAAGQSGGIALYYGFSSLAATASVPGTNDFTRPTGTVVNLIPFDRPVLTGTTSTIEITSGFHSARQPATFQAAMIQACRTYTTTGSQIVTGFQQTQYLARPQCADRINGASLQGGSCVKDPYLAFTGPNNNQAVIINQAGTLIICECGSLTGGLDCDSARSWTYAGLLTVSGPVGGQTWSIPVGAVFGLTVNGWGLGLKGADHDYLRIVSASSKCTDQNNKPDSVGFIKKGCPNCLSAVVTDIALLAVRSADDGSLPKIIKVRLFRDHIILNFSGDISAVFVTGDRLVVSADDLVIDGFARANWRKIDQFRAFQIAGRGRFGDELDACYVSGVTDCDDLLTGHYVTVIDGTSVSIPVGMDAFESVAVSVAAGGADWERHGRASTNSDLKAITEASAAIVCWGRKVTDGTIQYFMEAGRITFYKPNSMSAADVVPSTRLAGVVQPLTLSFTPNYRRDSIYTTIAQSHTLGMKITLLDTSKLDFLPTSSMDPQNLAGSFLDPALAGTNSSSICGKLFAEFSVNNNEGFPQPVSCMYSPTYTDQGLTTRELWVYFTYSDTGLRGLKAICTVGSTRTPCQYYMSFQGKLGTGLALGTLILRIDMACPFCSSNDDPYYIVETMTVTSGFSATAQNGNFRTALTVLPPSFAGVGYTYSSASDKDSIVMLSAISGTVTIKFALVRSTGGGILSASTIELMLNPHLTFALTGTTCTATSAAVSGTITCSIITLVKKSVVKLVLPALPTSINAAIAANGDTSYPAIFSVSLPSAGLPTGGALPHRMGVQLLSNGDDLSTVYAYTTSTSLVKVSESSILNTGRIVQDGHTGNGLRPFVGMRDNPVRVHLRMAKTIIGSGSVVKLHLPSGYECGGISWSMVGMRNVCQYTLSEGEMLNAGSWVVFDLVTNNPLTTLFHTDPANLWKVETASPGPGLTQLVSSEPAPFISQTSNEYTGNRAVIPPLKYAAIQPSSPLVNADQRVSIFLRTSYKLLAGSSLVIVAPQGFVFTNPCASVSLLPSGYYYQSSGGESLTFLADGDLVCGTSPLRIDLNSAVVTVTRIIDAPAVLGFTIGVRNPATAPVDSGWYIYVLDGNGNAIEGSVDPVESDGLMDISALGGSWRVASTGFLNPVSILRPSSQFLRPFAMTGIPETVNVGPIRVALSLANIDLTFTLPEGYEIVPGTFSSETFTTTPEILSRTKLMCSSISLLNTMTYNFSIALRIPESATVHALNNAYIEVSDSDDGTVRAAAPVTIAPLAVITGASASLRTPVANISTVLSFRFTTTHSLDQVSILGDASTSGFQYNPFNFWFIADTSSFPASSMVEVSEPLNGPVVIKVKPVNIAQVPAGTFTLDFNVTNPETPTNSDSLWTIQTIADFGQEVTTPQISHLIESAGITSVLDGRPGKSNRLKFFIGVDSGLDLSHPGTLTIYGPPRFIFNDDCSSDVTGITLSSCRGTRVDDQLSRSSLRMHVTSFGDVSDGFVNITVNVVRNPLTQPPENMDYWQLQLNSSHSSLNFDSFRINEITGFTLDFAYQGLSQVGGAPFPVRARFVPATTLPVSNTGPLVIRNDALGTLLGVLNYTMSSSVRIVAPAGFAWDSSVKDWADFRSLTPDLATKDVFEIGTDVYVNRTSNEITVVFIGTKTLEADTIYQLTSSMTNPTVAPAVRKWTITSYKPKDFLAVDEATLTHAAPIYPAGASLAVNVTSSSTAVLSATKITSWVNFSFPVTLPLTDQVRPITIRAPIGFSFTDAESGDCLTQPDLVGALALCPQGHNANELVVSLTAALAANTVKSLVVAVRTPDVMSAYATSNFWQSFVTVSGVTYSASASSFRVLGSVTSASLIASGAAHGAATQSALTLSFVPTYEGNAIHLNVSAPSGFNFSSASVPLTASYAINPRMTTASCWNCIALTGLKLTPGLVTNVTIDSVYLGQVGGDTEYSVQTFFIPQSSGVVFPLRVPSTFRDATNEIAGFFLPGKISVSSSTIRSVSTSSNALILNPLVESSSITTLTLTYSFPPFGLKTATGRFDQPALVRLEITCPQTEYEVVPSWADFTVRPSLGTLTQVPNVVSSSKIVAEWSTLMVTFNQVQTYIITLPVIPKSAVDSSMWRIDLFLNNTLIETNDGLTAVPSVITSIPVDSLTGRVSLGLTNEGDSIPPNTDVAITVKLLSSMPLGSTSIAIFAPTGFVFDKVPVSCPFNVCASLVPDSPHKLILSPKTAGAAFPATAAIDLTLHTPSEFAQAAFWTVVSYDALSGVTGWGTVDPITIHPMRGVTLLYGGMSGLDSQLFMLSFKIERTGSVNSLELVPPIGVSLKCYGQQLLENFACTSDSSLTGGLLLNCTDSGPYLAVGSYSLPLLVNLPLRNPTTNTFDLIGRNAENLLTDGIYGLAGRTIIDSDTLAVRDTSVTYLETVAGSKTVITVSFYLTKSVTAVDAINIHFPSEYFHEMTYASLQVTCINRRFPRVSPTEWVDASSTQSLTFLVDNTITSILDKNTGQPLQLNKIPAPETYVFEFPVVLPETTPTTGNYWTLSFCPNRTRIAQCIDETSSEAIAQFPVLGADLTSATAASKDSNPATSGASDFIRISWWTFCAVFLNSYF